MINVFHSSLLSLAVWWSPKPIYSEVGDPNRSYHQSQFANLIDSFLFPVYRLNDLWSLLSHKNYDQIFCTMTWLSFTLLDERRLLRAVVDWSCSRRVMLYSWNIHGNKWIYFTIILSSTPQHIKHHLCRTYPKRIRLRRYKYIHLIPFFILCKFLTQNTIQPNSISNSYRVKNPWKINRVRYFG